MHLRRKKNFPIDYTCPVYYNDGMRMRGKKRLITITYAQLAEWSGMAEGSVRNAVHQGRLDPTDIHAVIRWANSRREAKGLPAMGGAPHRPTLPPAAIAAGAGGYDPATGGYTDG